MHAHSAIELFSEGFDDEFPKQREEGGKDESDLSTLDDTTTSSFKDEEDDKKSSSSRASQVITLHTSQSSIVQAAAAGEPNQNNGFRNFLIKFLHGLGVCCSLTYTFCPPIPCCIVRKVAFHPPKTMKSYKILVEDENGNKIEVSTRKARKYSSIDIVPFLVEKIPRGYVTEDQIRKELRSTKGFVVKSKSGNDLVVGIFEPQKSCLIKNYQKKCILFSQPNSSDIGMFMQPFLPASFHNFCNYVGVRFYAFDYSGYGLSTGTATEKNIYQDIESVYLEIVKREGDDVMVTIVGFSIGTAAVVDLASKNYKNIVGVVLLAPFTSGLRLIMDNVKQKFHDCLDCFQSIDKVPNINVPILICHGTKDTVIPLSHGQKLYEEAKYKFDPLIVEGATHSNLLNFENNNVQYAIRCFVAMCDKFPEMIKNGTPLEVQKFLNSICD